MSTSKSFTPSETPQWCSLHQGPCEEVNILRRGRGDWVMVCTRCAALLRKARVVKVGHKVAFHTVLQLIGDPVEPFTASMVKNRSPFYVELTRDEVILLRAKGYELEVQDDM